MYTISTKISFVIILKYIWSNSCLTSVRKFGKCLVGDDEFNLPYQQFVRCLETFWSCLWNNSKFAIYLACWSGEFFFFLLYFCNILLFLIFNRVNVFSFQVVILIIICVGHFSIEMVWFRQPYPNSILFSLFLFSSGVSPFFECLTRKEVSHVFLLFPFFFQRSGVAWISKKRVQGWAAVLDSNILVEWAHRLRFPGFPDGESSTPNFTTCAPPVQ